MMVAMLTCLDREHRLAFLLTDVFDLPHAEAADLCGVAPAVYRQRVSRARRVLEAFTRSYCGLVVADAPCLCNRRVARAEALGRLSRHDLTFVRLEADALTAATVEMEGLHDSARLMRSHPPYRTPARVRERLRGTFAGLGAVPPSRRDG